MTALRRTGKGTIVMTVLGAMLANAPAANAAAMFGTPVEHVVTHYVSSVAAADVDLDGDVDLAIGHYGGVMVLRGDGAGGFPSRTDVPSGVGNGHRAIVSDVNADGAPDLLIANYTWEGSVGVMLNDGAGGFLPGRVIRSGNYSWEVAVADLNGDGVLDLAVANFAVPNANSYAGVHFGDGTGSFSAPVFYAVGPNASSVVARDWNLDGAMDLAFGHGQGISVLMGDGAGGFAPSVELAVPSQIRSLTALDVDRDGYLDLAAGTAYATAAVFKGSAAGFGPRIDYPMADWAYSIATADINRDGWDDLVGGNFWGASASVILADRAGGFRPPSVFPVGSYPYGIGVGDLDGDGAPEIAAARHSCPQLHQVCDKVSVVRNLTDEIAPVVTGVPDRAANANGWYDAPVTIDWQAVDAPPSSGAPTDPADTLAATEGAGVLYTSAPSCDPNGNCATGSLTLSIDRTDPSVTIDDPSLGSGLPLPAAAMSGTANDALSGVVSVDVTFTNALTSASQTRRATTTGGTWGVSTAGLPAGPTAASATATDAAGNATPTSEVVFLAL